jgi:hypothetical protein
VIVVEQRLEEGLQLAIGSVGEENAKLLLAVDGRVGRK